MGIGGFGLLVVAILTASNVTAETNTNCETLREAVVCQPSLLWKQVTEFPYGSYETKPTGNAAVFHLDGRGVGVVQSLPKISLQDSHTADELAEFWVKRLLDYDDIILSTPWSSLEKTIDGVKSYGRTTAFELDGRALVLRGNFVRTQRGDLLIHSFLNKKINWQAGDYLHNRLIAAVTLR
ncbi:MAG: hypothetical protein AAF871_02945 [Pseudomonadota bacterium]